MTKLTHLWTHESRQIAVVASLAFASVLCGALLVVRALYSDASATPGWPGISSWPGCR